MAVLFSEGLEGGTLGGDVVDDGSTLFAPITGAGAAAVFVDEAYEGNLAMRVAPGASGFRLHEIVFPAEGLVWLSFGYKRKAEASSNTAVINFWGNGGTTKIGDVRELPDGTLQLRAVSAQVWVSPVLPVDEQCRGSLLIDAAGGSLRLRIYAGANVDGTTPDYDSAPQAVSPGVATVDNIRLGAATADATLDYILDRVIADDAVEPAGVTAPPPASDVPYLFYDTGAEMVDVSEALWYDDGAQWVNVTTGASPVPAAWGDAWAANDQSVLLDWFKANTGPTVALTTTTTGTYTVASQADADALVGRTVTGRIVVTASCTMRDFRLVNDGSASTALDIAGGLTVTVEDFEIDGAGHDTTVAGVGGGSWATVTMRRAHIHHCLDAVRLCEGSTYENLFVHDPIYVPTYSGSSTQHADAVQAVRGATPIVVTKSWLDHGADPSGNNITSAAIIKSDSAAIDDVTIDYTYLNGGGYTITIEAGANGAPTNIKVRNNRIGRNYRNGVWSGAGVNNGADYDRTGNVWADDFTPATTTWGFLGAGQTYVDPGY